MLEETLNRPDDARDIGWLLQESPAVDKQCWNRFFRHVSGSEFYNPGEDLN
jgi:hypothetical protein